MAWTFQADAPIYTQLVQQLTVKIVSGAYPLGEKLPSVRDLAMEAGVNPNTLQRAFGELERQGLVYGQRTAGRFVTEDETMVNEAKKLLAQTQIQGFLQAMQDLGYSVQEMIALLQENETEQKEEKTWQTS